jgi:membrane protease subunit HflC
MIRTIGIIFLFGVIFVGLQSVYTVNELQQALILRVGEPVGAVNEVGDEDPGLSNCHSSWMC